MNTTLKQLFILGFIVFPLLSFAQSERFIEITVSDTILLKATGLTYQVDIGEKNEFMGMSMLEGFEDEIEPVNSIKDLTKAIEKGGFQYTLSSEKDYSITFSKSDPSILVQLADEKELKALVTLLNQQEGITGKVKEVRYESSNKYQDQTFKKLYAKALAQATMMSNVSGNSIGQLLSISESKTASFDYLDFYQSMLKNMPGMMKGESNINDKKEEVKMTFKFELK